MNIKQLLNIKDVSREEIEVIFRTSNSPDELFDAFRLAISGKIKDAESYKTLLWNKALSTDEIAMFAEKICKEFPDLSYPVYFAVGQIYSSISFYGKHLNKALTFFKKAADAKPAAVDPYIAILKMYNRELNIPGIEEIENTVLQGIEPGKSTVENKSSLCFALSDLFKRIGKREKERKYRKLGEKYQKEGQ